MKRGDEVYVVDVKSETQTIKLLQLKDDKYVCKILDSRTGQQRLHAATAIYKSIFKLLVA